MKFSSAVTTSFLSLAANVGVLEQHLNGFVTSNSAGCDWEGRYVNQRAILEVDCDQTEFKVGGIAKLGEIRIPEDSPVKTVIMEGVYSGGELIAPGVTKVSTNGGKFWAHPEGGCIHIAEDGEVFFHEEIPDIIFNETLTDVVRGSSSYSRTDSATCPKYDEDECCPDLTKLNCPIDGSSEYFGMCSFRNQTPSDRCTLTVPGCGGDDGNFEIGDVVNGAKVILQDADLTTFKFDQVWNHGKAFACSTNGLMVEGDTIFNEGGVYTGPHSEFDVGEVNLGGQTMSFDNDAQCFTEKDNSGGTRPIY